MNELGSIQDRVDLGLGPVRLYPHQTFTADFVLSDLRRCLLADEVGLGKTLEAGAIIKRLVQERQVDRILILAPKNVARQWMEEMDYHFDLIISDYMNHPHAVHLLMLTEMISPFHLRIFIRLSWRRLSYCLMALCQTG